MYKLEFEIVHRGCLVNEISRALPDLRLICPGGFILSPSTVEEIIAIDQPKKGDGERLVDALKRKKGIAEVELIEQTADKAFIRILTSINPDTGFCSEAVHRNRAFRIGMEIQEGGLEKWKVACFRKSDAENLVGDLKKMGELKMHRITETSWQDLLDGR